MRILFLLLALLGTGAALADDAHTLARGRELSKLFLERKHDALWAQMTPKMQEALKSVDALGAFRDQVGAQLGDEADVLDEKTTTVPGFTVYLRTARWSKLPARIVMQFALDADDRVAGFFVRPDPSAAKEQAPTTHLDYRTKASLRLPFDGEWYVFWGGRTLEQNYHGIDRGQRFAYDILVMRDDKSHDGDGTKLEQYYCWNRPILAPADATVVARVDSLPDQAPGKMDPAHATGNHVVLDLGDGEYAFVAHLRQGSVRVEEGARVARGDELGRCGNSGNTSEPHLHFHLQDTPKFGAGDGLPAQFVDYVADGKPVARGEPLKGQRVRVSAK
jgi:hypothetical protein